MSPIRIIVGVIIAIALPTLVHGVVGKLRPVPPPPSVCCPTPESRAEYETFYAHLTSRRHLMFSAGVPIGVIAIIAGTLARRAAIGRGLMVGGILTVADAYNQNRSELPRGAWLASVGAAFLASAFFGYRMLKRRRPEPRRLGYALAIGIAVTATGKLPLLAARLVFLPGFLVAMALGGTFDEPGPINEQMSVVLTVAASLVIWTAVAYLALRSRTWWRTRDT